MTESPELALLHALPFPAALLNASGIVIAANGPAEAVLGAGLVGTPFFPIAIPGAAATPAESAYRQGMATSEVQTAFALPGRRLLVRSLPGPERRALALIVDESGAGSGAVLAQVREIASKVKHDVNNVLMGLLGQTSLLQSRPDVSAVARAKIAVIEEQGRKIRDTVARLDAIRTLSDA